MNSDHRKSNVPSHNLPAHEVTSVSILNPAVKVQPTEIPALQRPEPTRYGDWEKKGRCIDF